jgi:hypothetical protein
MTVQQSPVNSKILSPIDSQLRIQGGGGAAVSQRKRLSERALAISASMHCTAVMVVLIFTTSDFKSTF